MTANLSLKNVTNMIEACEVKSWQKASEVIKYQIAGMFLQADQYAEGFGADNDYFSDMVYSVLKCMSNPSKENKLSMATVILDSVSAYYGEQATKLIDTVNADTDTDTTLVDDDNRERARDCQKWL